MYYQWKVFETQNKDNMVLGKLVSPSIYYAANSDQEVKIDSGKYTFAGGKLNADIFTSDMHLSCTTEKRQAVTPDLSLTLLTTYNFISQTSLLYPTIKRGILTV